MGDNILGYIFRLNECNSKEEFDAIYESIKDDWSSFNLGEKDRLNCHLATVVRTNKRFFLPVSEDDEYIDQLKTAGMI